MKFILMFIMLFGVVVRAHALANLVVDAVTIEGDYSKISYTLSNWSSGDAGISACGQGYPVCHIRITARKVSDSPSGIIWSIPLGSGIDQYLTLGQIVVELKNKLGVSMPYRGSFLITRLKNLEEHCLVIESGGGEGRLSPVTDCVALRAPAPVVQCDIGGSTTIDHRTLSDTALNGAQASIQLTFKCNNSASVIVKATRTNSYGVRLKYDSLYSEVKINNKDATDGINVSVINNMSTPLTITSTLKTRGAVEPGPFSGFTLISVEPY